MTIACLFVEIGGVLLTDGWDHHARKRAAKTFRLKWDDLDSDIIWSLKPTRRESSRWSNTWIG